jgi:hypothetical protein
MAKTTWKKTRRPIEIFMKTLLCRVSMKDGSIISILHPLRDPKYCWCLGVWCCEYYHLPITTPEQLAMMIATVYQHRQDSVVCREPFLAEEMGELVQLQEKKEGDDEEYTWLNEMKDLDDDDYRVMGLL